jgi:hypothetical protein
MTNLSIAFLIIITIAGGIYALVTKQLKVGLGLLVIAVAFVLAIPELVTGFWVDLLLALSLIIYLVGMIIIVYKKKETEIKSELEMPKDNKERNE